MKMVLSSLWVLVIACLATFGCGAGVGAPPSPSPTPSTPSITFQKAVMMWPNTWCLTSSSCSKVRPPSAFRMHGVWPADSNGKSVNDCQGEDANLKEIDSTTKEEMKKCWPGYSKPNDAFWMDEWTRHGKCSRLKPIDYFKTGARLCTSLTKDIDLAFSKQRIEPGPSQHYQLQAYYNAILNHFRYRPQIRCQKLGSKTYLKEIVFCYDLNFQLTDCPPKGRIATVCSESTSSIYFP